MIRNRMKKIIWLLLFVLVSFFTFVACANDDSDAYEENGYEENGDNNEDDDNGDEDENGDDNGDAENDYAELNGDGDGDADVGPHGFPLIQLTDASRDIALEDFEYLAELMLENVPSQVVVERRFGAPLEDILDFMRDSIVNMDPIESLHFIIMGEEYPTGELPTEDLEIAADYLSSLLLWLTIDLQGLGHLSPQTLEGFAEMLEIHLALLHQMEIVDGRMMVNDEDQGSAESLPWLESRADAFSAEASLWFYGMTLDDIDLYRDMEDFGFREEGNVTTEVIEEGRIGHIHIESFMNNRAFDSEVLFPFYEEIQDFDHLIIDVRGNAGGTLAYVNYIIPMLIDEPLEATYHEFLMAGDLITQELEDGAAVTDEDEFADVMPASDFVKEEEFPYFISEDLDILEYVVTWPLTYEPRDDNIPFEGEIWLLVDGESASLSELLAMIAIDSGFATVVGEPTAGITPTLHVYISLPNTGIVYRMDVGYIIDSQGRSIEEHGVIPDIVIEPGDDALDIVLELIE